MNPDPDDQAPETSPEFKDDLANFIEASQMVALMIRGQYVALSQAGFNEAQAMRLTIEWMKVQLRNNGGRGPGGDDSGQPD